MTSAICENCSDVGLDSESLNKCEKCGRLACPHRFREGYCAPCFVASKAASDGNELQVTPARVSELFPTVKAKATGAKPRSKTPSNEISAALNGLDPLKCAEIAKMNGLSAEWAGWMKKFATNPGMARMQLNGALRRKQAKGEALKLSTPAEEAVAMAETPKERAQRESAAKAAKAKTKRK